MKNSFLYKRLRGVRYAAKGAWILISTEPSIQVQIFVSIVVICAGFYFDISNVEWILQLFAIALVLSVEGLNTAVEGIADFVHPDFHNKIGYIKDVAAGAVFFSAIIAVVIAAIIYFPKML